MLNSTHFPVLLGSGKLGFEVLVQLREGGTARKPVAGQPAFQHREGAVCKPVVGVGGREPALLDRIKPSVLDQGRVECQTSQADVFAASIHAPEPFPCGRHHLTQLDHAYQATQCRGHAKIGTSL